ncbi:MULTISPECIES: acylphosphatase [Halomonas]|uniref:acylphosphatase n=2 Tax=Halomonas TaxID=2745 RepID=A0A7X4VXJ0_9GAMM|nr:MULTISPECIES: acylphosphatase [Halomonas]MDR5902143.1 acylphosphatase [Halomonas icarae]NAW12157.1 acylphosphatase [Halomonas icarae]TDB05546.1 acylphosphatase [Halomonas marinisediminis]
METTCVKALVTGKVQGVWYRRATQEQALQQGLTGHAINLPDGRVEVLLCGRPAAVREVGEWLWRGPEHARVTHVEFNVVETHAPDDFRTG